MPPVCNHHGKGQMTSGPCGTSPRAPSSGSAKCTYTHTQFSSQIGSQAQSGAPAAARAGGSQRGALKESPSSPSPEQPSTWGQGAGPGSRRAGVFPGPAADLLRQQITALVYIGCRWLPSGPTPPGCLHNPEHRRPHSSSNRSIRLALAPDDTSSLGELDAGDPAFSCNVTAGNAASQLPWRARLLQTP